jgi:uncharacterized protein (UPF0264 family)
MPATRRSIAGDQIAARPGAARHATALTAPPFRAAPRLLVSVTGPDEARLAFEAGADIVDLKDPGQGALGACAPAILMSVAALRDSAFPEAVLSAALGPADDPGAAARAAAAAGWGFDFVKLGLERLKDDDAAVGALRSIVAAVGAATPSRRGGARGGTRVIAASFADADRVDALAPEALPGVAAAAGAAGALLDTAVKDGRTLIDHLPPTEIARYLAACRRSGLLAAVAGALETRTMPEILALAPDIIGVRGAVCLGGRTGRLDRRRLERLRDALRVAPALAG